MAVTFRERVQDEILEKERQLDALRQEMILADGCLQTLRWVLVELDSQENADFASKVVLNEVQRAIPLNLDGEEAGYGSGV